MTGEVPDLQDFKEECAKQMLRSNMFQHEKKKKINLLKFPVIMAPRVLGRQVNTSSVKKSVFRNKAGETQEYSEKVLTKFSQLVEAKKLNILKIDQIGGTELRDMAEDLGLIPNKMYSKKSDVALRNELETIAGYLLHEQKRGQGVCHQYVQVSKGRFTKLDGVALLKPTLHPNHLVKKKL